MASSPIRPLGGLALFLILSPAGALAADPPASPWRPGQTYPAEAAAAGRHGSSIVGFGISETGQVENCTTVQSSGTPLLDGAACHLIEEGTVFKVATPPPGQPLQRLHSETTVHWVIAGAAQTPDDLPITTSDIVVPQSLALARHNRGRTVARQPVRGALPVDALPEGLADGRGGTTASVLTIDPRGRVVGCDVVRTSGTPELDKTTCDFARARLRYAPAADAAGQPLHGLDLFTFNWAPPAPAEEPPAQP